MQACSGEFDENDNPEALTVTRLKEMAEVDRDYQTLRYLLSNNLPWGNACQEYKASGREYLTTA